MQIIQSLNEGLHGGLDFVERFFALLGVLGELGALGLDHVGRLLGEEGLLDGKDLALDLADLESELFKFLMR